MRLLCNDFVCNQSLSKVEGRKIRPDWTFSNQVGTWLLPCPFTGPKTFWACSNFLCHKYQKLIYILCQTKRWVSYSKFSFCAGTKLFGVALKFYSIFGLAQNIWTGTKHFGSCRRTRQPFYRESKEEEKTTLPVDIRRAKKILTSAGMSTNMISVV